MSDESKNIDRDCLKNCDQSFEECLSSGEDESVCRMKRVPCDCSCMIG
ncbi:hypothetical protein dsmv_2928 [Desulfococcus multivorans DSM 2059]|jgi:hypothetical protein|uniref:Uncharacterized protein n=1 Tax=Desulfococcus multivorans DSM 2059 TaxID=1121405 RepID=S7UZM4_DESML|nr:hypothetical protein dsmv_2928 [Desulfococcus multivorans DSM 2059]SKA16128.1 hypothetical protein SAMN02745446_03025 [Desulfococcus multivorans DSM 2059]